MFPINPMELSNEGLTQCFKDAKTEIKCLNKRIARCKKYLSC